VAVMYAGKIFELADVLELFENSLHPYTRGLMHSIPAGASRDGKLASIPGQPPNLLDLAPGCPFAPRCSYTTDRCRAEEIVLRRVSGSHYSSCLRFEEIWN
jgi:peptide/nickel transport system ATP-binding protein